MAVMEIAVDIGTSYTSIYLSGNGIVLHEPTVVAFHTDGQNRRLRAVGKQALEMLGKAPEKTSIVSPVIDGVIVDFEVCSIMLTEFINKILPDNYLFFPKIKAILAVPTGLTLQERKMYEDVLFSAKISNVTMIDNIMLAAIGIDLPVNTTMGGFIVNVGGGNTQIAALSLYGIISGCAVNIGGDMMDRAVSDYIIGEYNLKLGLSTIRKLKTEMGTLYPNDNSKMKVNGIDVRTKGIAGYEITSEDIRLAITTYYEHIGQAIESIINMCPPDYADNIKKCGIYLTGGAAQIQGLDDYLSRKLALKVFIAEDPSYAAIIGAGKLLSNEDLLNELLCNR